MAKSVLVIGSGGNVGGPLAEELAASGESVRAATREPARFKGPQGVTPVKFDYTDPGTFTEALEDTDRVFVMAPPGDARPHQLMLPFLESAAREGRKFVLMTAAGVEYNEQAPLRQVERDLERSGTRTVFLRPNWFMDNFHTNWLPSIRNTGAIRVPAADSRSAFIDARDIAASAAAAMRSDRFDGEAFTLTGPESLTYDDAARVLSEAASREIRYEPVDDASFTESLRAAGVPADYAAFLTSLFGFVRQGFSAATSDGVRRITGRDPRTLAEYAADRAAAWR